MLVATPGAIMAQQQIIVIIIVYLTERNSRGWRGSPEVKAFALNVAIVLILVQIPATTCGSPSSVSMAPEYTTGLSK